MAKKPKRWIVFLGIIVLSLLGALWSGGPQKFVLTSILENALGAKVEVSGGHYGSTLTWDSIAIYPPEDTRHLRPVIVLEGLSIAYDLFAEDGRKVPTVHMNTLTLSPDVSDPNAVNYQFLLDLLEAESTSDDVTWLPRTITMDEVSLKGRWPEGTLSVAGIHVAVACRSLNDIGVHIEVDDQQENSHLLRGRITLDWRDSNTALEVQDLVGALEGRSWIPLLDYLSPDSGLAVERVTFSTPSVHWNSSKGNYPSGTLNSLFQGLEISRAEEKIFAGEVALATTFQGGESLDSRMDLKLNQTLSVAMHMELSDTNNRVMLEMQDWDKTGLLTTLPPSLQSGIEGLPFEQLLGALNAEWDDQDYAVDGSIQSENKTIDLDLALRGEIESPSSVLGTLDARMGDGLLQASGQLDDSGMYRGEINLKQVPLSPLALLATEVLLPESLSGVLEGKMVAQELAGHRVQLQPAITLSDLHYEAMQFDALQLSGEVILDYDTRVAHSEIITIQTEDESIHLVAQDIQLTLDSGDLTAAVDYTFPVETLAIETAYGTMAGTAQLKKTHGSWIIPVEFFSDYLGYGDLALPYGTELNGKGTLRYHDDTQVLQLDEAHAKIGEGTLIIVPKAELNEAGWFGEAQVDSELSLLIEMGYIADVDGVVHAEATWSPEKELLAVEWKAKADIATLALLDQAGTVSRLVSSMEGRYDTQFHGEGTVSVEALSAAGATISEFSGPLHFKDNALLIPESSAQIFAGTVASRIAVQVMEPGFPIDINATLSHIDLARMTEEVQPPKAQLTGIGQGTIEVRYTLTDGLQEFDLDMDSEENFTVNRSLVEELMQMQTVLSGLGEKKAQRTLDKFLGKAAQRPFDSASMHVFLLDNSVLGVSEMHSEKTQDYNGLNLVIQLDIDKPALVQSLKMLEESSVAEMEF